MPNKRPYLTVVMASRNDNYQGASFKRLEMAFNNLVEQAKRYNLRLEIIFVDWNPPEGKPLLKDALQMPKDMGSVKVRFIVVPNRVHRSYNPSERINIIGTAAFNVGIRRAEGEFIFATNSDILFSAELIRFLASEILERDCFYKAERFDVCRNVMDYTSPDEIDDFCKKNIINSYQKDNMSHHGLKNHPNLHINSGDFILFSREYWGKVHGWPELNNIGLYADGLLCYMAYLSGLKENFLDASKCVYHIDHDSRWKKMVSPKTKIFDCLQKKFYKYSKNLAWKNFLRKFRHLADTIIVFFSKKDDNPEKKDFDIRRMRLQFLKILSDMLKRKEHYAYNGDLWGSAEEKFEEFAIN